MQGVTKAMWSFLAHLRQNSLSGRFVFPGGSILAQGTCALEDWGSQVRKGVVDPMWVFPAWSDGMKDWDCLMSVNTVL